MRFSLLYFLMRMDLTDMKLVMIRTTKASISIESVIRAERKWLKNPFVCQQCGNTLRKKLITNRIQSKQREREREKEQSLLSF